MDNYIILTEDGEINLDDIKSVYYRNGTIHFQLPDIESDEHLKNFISDECRSIIDFINYYLIEKGVTIHGNFHKLDNYRLSRIRNY